MRGGSHGFPYDGLPTLPTTRFAHALKYVVYLRCLDGGSRWKSLTVRFSIGDAYHVYHY